MAPIALTGAMWWRGLVVVHRYLGVAIGVLMLMWFGSGIVMMYVSFPQLSEPERLAALPPIPWQACCRHAEQLADDDTIVRAQVEAVLGSPALRLRRPGQPDALINLARGTAIRIDAALARAIAIDAVARLSGPANAREAEQIDLDQWTVGRYGRDRPLFRVGFGDAQRTVVYVSGTSGQIVLRTTATQRFWNWFGAIPHWLYPTLLRSQPALWSQIVIWTAIAGTFLTVVGIVLGITQLRIGRGRSVSPYRGLFYWHHVAGLFFGVVTLTWVASGLVSMNPWGFLDSRGRGEQATLQGAAIRWHAMKASLDATRMRDAAAEAVSLTGAPFAGRLYWLATRSDGAVHRLDANGEAAPLTDSDLAAAAQRLAGPDAIAEQGLMRGEDAYYFGNHEPVALPVYRVVVNDAERTRYYLNPVSGLLLKRADQNGRWHRWLFGGLHRIDFTATLRARPLWDIVVLTLMAGGLALAATGVWLAIRRIRRDIARLLRPRARAQADR